MPTAAHIIAGRSRDVARISEDDTVVTAAMLMSQSRIGSLVVTRGADKVVGIFTERDVLNRVVAVRRDPEQTLIGDVMTTPVACCQPSTRLSEVSSVMSAKRIRHMPVVEGGKLVGMISSGDLLALENSEQQQTIEYLHEYLIEGTR
jgi:IMP dehydrogenase